MKLEELKKKMKGVVVVHVTPFNKDGSVDMGGLRSNIQWIMEKSKGKDVILNPLGSSGEFFVMSDDECKAIMKATIEEVNGKFPVFVGAGRPGTLETIKMCKYAESVGVDGVQIILPYYFPPTEEGMYQHFAQVAASVKVAVMVYNYPVPSGSWIKPHLMAKLAQIPNIIASKENTDNLLNYVKMKKEVDPTGMTVFAGLGEPMFIYEAIYGCPGHVSSSANAFFDWSYAVYDAAKKKEFKKMEDTVNVWNPYLDFLGRMVAKRPHCGVHGGSSIFIACIKAAMDIVGIRGGDVRSPQVNLTAEEKKELAGIIKTLKLPA